MVDCTNGDCNVTVDWINRLFLDCSVSNSSLLDLYSGSSAVRGWNCFPGRYPMVIVDLWLRQEKS
jgi:hypothetical protein